jgi:hypothetical protein
MHKSSINSYGILIVLITNEVMEISDRCIEKLS